MAETSQRDPQRQAEYDFIWDRLNALHLKYGDIRESVKMPDLPILEQGISGRNLRP